MTAPLRFTPLDLREPTLKNRVVVAPMHQYAGERGFATDWHLMNAGRHAAGGAGLFIVESTKVERRGCGTVGDPGLWDDAFIPGLRRIVDFTRACGAAVGIQLGHSGRKSRGARPWEGGKPLTREQAEAAGTFLNPQSNQRTDDDGGSLANRLRFALEVAEAARAAWPAHKPLAMRLSVDDGCGWDPASSVVLALELKALGVDLVDCSGGGMLPGPVPGTPPDDGDQVPYAAKLRAEAGIATMAVGLIVQSQQAEAVLQQRQADLVALARELLYNPNWPLDVAQKLGAAPQFQLAPPAAGWWLERRRAGAPGVLPSTFPSPT